MNATIFKPDVPYARLTRTLKMRCPECLAGFHYFSTWLEKGRVG